MTLRAADAGDVAARQSAPLWRRGADLCGYEQSRSDCGAGAGAIEAANGVDGAAGIPAVAGADALVPTRRCGGGMGCCMGSL
jgi:hypothetical protein